MTRAEKAAYRALHGPFPEDPPTREIIASSRKRAEIKSIKVPVAPKQPEEEKDETQENNVQSV